MYRLLIVEDEKWEREGLRDFLDWSGLGIEVAGCACNGEEGLKMAEQYRPDIVVTDIMMPKMDGIRMSLNIRTILPNARIILLSGYDDFQFAKRSFDFHAFAYLLKPIGKKPFEEVIHRVLKALDQERDKSMEREALKSRWTDYVQANKDRLLLDLLEGRTESKYVQKLPLINGIKPEGRKAVAILFLFYGPEKDQSPGSVSNSRTQERMDEIGCILSHRGIAYAFIKPGKEAVLCMDVPTGQPELEAQLLQLGHALKKELGIDTIIGFGETVKDITDAHRSYSQAKEACSRRFLAEYGELLFPGGREEHGGKEPAKAELPIPIAESMVGKLAYSIQKGDRNEFALLAEDFLSFLRENRSVGKLLLGIFFNQIAGSFHADLPERELDSLPQTRRYLMDCFDRIASRETDKSNRKEEEIAQKVIEIIEGRYHESLDLKLVSEEIHLSPYYIGSIFKKTTGKVFSQYLNDYRIEKAKEILLSRRIKVGQLAEKVGIRNPSYFCMLFKDRFGISPGDYRDIRKGRREYV